MELLIELKKKIVDAMRYMDEKGLNHGRSGNVSIRVDRERVLITPSGVVKSELKPEDIVLINMNGEVLEGIRKPTVEVNLHLEIYRAYDYFNAVVHAHPVYSSVLAVLREPLPPVIEEMVLYTGGEIRVAEYAPFGTIELARNAVEALRDRSAVILANHGVVACGRNLDEALEILELVERVAQIYILVRATGLKYYTVPLDSLEKIREIYRSKFKS